MLVALISASTFGSIRPGSGGGAVTARSSGRPSHCARLNTVKRLRNGMAWASSPDSRARFFSSSEMKAVDIYDGGAVLALADVATKAEGLAKRQPSPGRESSARSRNPKESAR